MCELSPNVLCLVSSVSVRSRISLCLAIGERSFEVIEIVPKCKNILEREKYWIQALYRETPEKSLNISCTKGLVEEPQLQIESEGTNNESNIAID